MNICYVHEPAAPPDARLVEALGGLPTPAISDAMERTNGAVGIRPVLELEGSVAGPALTVKTRPGDNLVVHKALDLARPGEVLAIDAGGKLENAILGEIICSYAEAKGIAAIVVDGAVRDVRAIRRLGFPIFARGVNHMGPYKSGPGEIGGPIALGGTVVRAGDILVGDADGVVVVPCAGAEQVAKEAHAIVIKEKEMFAAIEKGALDRSWVDEALRVEKR